MQNVLGSLFHVTVFYIGSHVVSWSIIINSIHVVLCAETVLIVEQ